MAELGHGGLGRWELATTRLGRLLMFRSLDMGLGLELGLAGFLAGLGTFCFLGGAGLDLGLDLRTLGDSAADSADEVGVLCCATIASRTCITLKRMRGYAADFLDWREIDLAAAAECGLGR